MDHQETHAIAVRIVETANSAERTALLEWSQDLLRLRNAPLSKLEKSKQALITTQKRKIIFPLIKIIFQQTKKHMWDDRSTKGRFGIAGAVAGLTFFGGQSAGIAALGSAFGLPLWIVFGAGSTFAGVIIEEVKNRNIKDSGFEYTVINDDDHKA